MRTRACLAFLAPVTATLLLAACGSDSADSSNTSGAAATEAPATSAATASPMPSSAAAATGTIVDVAAGNPDFATLVTAVKAAGLAEERMGVSGFGPSQPVSPNDTADARQRNRRVEIFVVGPETPVVGWTETHGSVYQ